jgi:hypothetical protein
MKEKIVKLLLTLVFKLRKNDQITVIVRALMTEVDSLDVSGERKRSNWRNRAITLPPDVKPRDIAFATESIMQEQP